MTKNKKILFLVLSLIVISTGYAYAADAGSGGSSVLQGIVDRIRTSVGYIGSAMVIIGCVIAGILYLSSTGSPEKLGIAKKALVAAIIGTFLMVLAYTGLIWTIITEIVGT